MNITLVVSTLTFGGAERVISSMANYWASNGWRVTLVTLSSEAHDCYQVDGRVTRIGLGLVGDSNNIVAAIANNARRVLALRRAIKSTESSAVVTFQNTMNVLVVLAATGLGLPVIVSERTDPRQQKIGKIWTNLRKWTYARAAALVVQTEAVRSWAYEIVGEGKSRVIENPVNEAFAQGQCRGSQRTIVAMGRLHPEKGFDVLLRAFARIEPEFAAWRLMIIGDGAARRDLEQLVKELGLADRVLFMGNQKSPETLLVQCEIFVLPSRYEGFPNALLEAMACGLAVISTDCPSGPREIIRDGIDGLLVPSEDDHALAVAIRQLLADPALRARLGERAIEVRRRFSLPAVMAKWERLICDAIEAKTAR